MNGDTLFEDLKQHVLENTYWGRFIHGAQLLVAGALIHALLPVSPRRKRAAKR